MNIRNTSLSGSELTRYHRHIIIPEFGVESQEKLKNARVLVVGAGGLGSPLLLYLTAAGVGKIGIMDFDKVEDSNLQRQVLFTTDQVGKSKVASARDKLSGLNSFIEVITHDCELSSDNAMQLIGNYDVVADGTDNFATRYLVNDACVLLGKPNVYASIFQFEGQVSVFNYKDKAGEVGPNYRDLFAVPPPEYLVPSCAVGGVLGVLPGIIGAMQALEVIKVITGIGEVLTGRLFTFDALTFQSRILNIKKDAANPLTGLDPTIHELIDYKQFCKGKNVADMKINSISIEDFMALRNAGEDFQLIDVREEWEYNNLNLGGELIPIGILDEKYEKLARNRRIIIHCKSGGRSEKAIRMLQGKYGFNNLINLRGGIDAYLQYTYNLKPQVGHTLPT